ncbi:hypothetical protein NDNC_0420 [Candidatus Nasuia deltocephalinicola]|nr:hypothetical protein NDNC_0420 [Candidatus Nasuia deltocephalinicola]
MFIIFFLFKNKLKLLLLSIKKKYNKFKYINISGKVNKLSFFKKYKIIKIKNINLIKNNIFIKKNIKKKNIINLIIKIDSNLLKKLKLIKIKKLC